MSIAAHGGDHGWISPTQIYENVSEIGLRRIGLKVYVAAFAIAQADKADCSGMSQLGSGPQPFSGKRPVGLSMNQADELRVVRHGRELAADGRHGEMESLIEHGLHFGIGVTRRKMNFQRTANNGVTGCLSLGVHPKPAYAYCFGDAPFFFRIFIHLSTVCVA